MVGNDRRRTRTGFPSYLDEERQIEPMLRGGSPGIERLM